MISLRSPLDHKHITHDRCRWQQQEWDKMKKNYEIVLVEGKIPRMVCAVFTCQVVDGVWPVRESSTLAVVTIGSLAERGMHPDWGGIKGGWGNAWESIFRLLHLHPFPEPSQGHPIRLRRLRTRGP